MWRRESALLQSDVEDVYNARARRRRSMPSPSMPSSSVLAATLCRARGARASWCMSRHVASRAFLALERFDSWNDASDAVEPSLRTRVCGMSCDKVFSCAWVDTARVVFGTKCNRVFEVDVGRRRMSRADDGESMKTNDAAKEVFIHRGGEGGSEGGSGGTYATCVNATREIVLASGGDAHDVCLLRFQSDDSRAAGCETSSLASSLEPYCALRGHTDVVYGADFITRDIVATCARDGCVKIWRAPPPPLSGAAAPTSLGALETVYPFTSGPATRVRGVKYLDDLSCPTLATITTHEFFVQVISSSLGSI
jgi:WD40 repeat protein